MSKGIIDTLIEKRISITVMESCTSGLVASRITDTEGASAIFKGGIVTYSNDMKVMMGVDKEIIDRYGVYSSQCAEGMAKAVKEKMKADIAIGVTGTTGNVDPNNEGSIVGEVFFCIIVGGEVHLYNVKSDVKGKSRREIKEEYVDCIMRELQALVG